MKIHKNVKFDEVEEQIAETLKHAPAQKDGPKCKQVIHYNSKSSPFTWSILNNDLVV